VSLDELRAAVAVMRELGVTRYGEIVLGPPPMPPLGVLTEEEKLRKARDKAHQDEERKLDVLFASSNFRPRTAKVGT
jgi:hypothetical protein